MSDAHCVTLILSTRLVVASAIMVLVLAMHLDFAAELVRQDLRRVTKSTGAQVQTTVSDVLESELGTCAVFEERQVGGKRYNIFTGCPQVRAAIHAPHRLGAVI